MTIVVDASIALKWLLPEPDSIDAEGVASGDHLLIAPTLVIAESCNAVWKRLRRGQVAAEQAQLVVARLPKFFDALVADAGLASMAMTIARALDHPVYDCFYLALAETGGGNARDRRPAAGGARARYALGGPGGGSRRLGRDGDENARRRSPRTRRTRGDRGGRGGAARASRSPSLRAK